MTIDRQLIADRFGSAFASYDEAATPQQRVVAEMMALLTEEAVTPPQRILEIGCGTGLFTEQLATRYPQAELTLNDLVPEAEHWVGEKLPHRPFAFVTGDAEQWDWGKGYQLIASSSCIQWWQEPLAFIRKAYNALTPGGTLALSTFLPENLSELRPILPNALHYPVQAEYAAALTPFSDVVQRALTIELQFSSLLELLRHLKATGTNAFTHTRQGLWSRGHLLRLEEELRQAHQLTSEEPLSLTYHPLIIIAQK